MRIITLMTLLVLSSCGLVSFNMNGHQSDSSPESTNEYDLRRENLTQMATEEVHSYHSVLKNIYSSKNPEKALFAACELTPPREITYGVYMKCFDEISHSHFRWLGKDDVKMWLTKEHWQNFKSNA